MEKIEKTDIKATMALLLAMIIWATSFVVLKATFKIYDPMFVICGRMFIGSFIFLFVIKKLWKKCSYQKGDYLLLLLMAIFEPCLYFIFEAIAITKTTASQAGMISSTLPILVAISAFFILKEKTTILTWLGFFVAVAGVVILSIYSEVTVSAPNPILGNFLEFCAMICATGYTIVLKRLSSRYDPFFLTAVICFIGSIFFLPLALIEGGGFPQEFVLLPVLGIVYLGSVVTIGGYGLFSVGVSRTKASTAAAFINLIPVFTVFFSWIFLGEKMNITQYCGCGLIFVGVYLSQKK
ncbi:MAG: DMT family transporter [Leptospirales bacterium]|nr:DMT family transporter [Leptospirales bacterium]